MKITYVYHSCFVVELTTVILIFDYFKGDLPKLATDKNIYVFSSHKHHDHFSLKIFDWMKEYEGVTYVLSNDIRLSENYLRRQHIDPIVKERIVFAHKNERYTIGEGINRITVETLASTDQGVAFIVEVEGKTIYHAGDLNWWTWIGESDIEFKNMTKRYHEEIRKIEHRYFDLAFVVLDPRQEERYWWGLDYFTRKTRTRTIIPMHCWEKYEIIQDLKKHEVAAEYKNQVMEYKKPGETIII